MELLLRIFVGGRIYFKIEKRLPQKWKARKDLIYREWDVHPKDQSKPRGRKAHYGDDKSAYYTKDHYFTFFKTQIMHPIKLFIEKPDQKFQSSDHVLNIT